MSGTPCTNATVLDAQNNTSDTQISVEYVLTTARMMPSMTATTNAITEVMYNNLDADSTSDYGSCFDEGDTYFPVNEGSDLMDSTYKPSFMGEDGSYEDLLSGLTTCIHVQRQWCLSLTWCC